MAIIPQLPRPPRECLELRDEPVGELALATEAPGDLDPPAYVLAAGSERVVVEPVPAVRGHVVAYELELSRVGGCMRIPRPPGDRLERPHDPGRDVAALLVGLPAVGGPLAERDIVEDGVDRELL